MTTIDITLTTPDVITATVDNADVINVTIEESAPIVVTFDTGVGAQGAGVPDGGDADQVLAKRTGADFDTYWKTGGGGGGAVDSVNTQTGDVVLDADDISDTSTTNKFTNTTEKSTWNGKQDALGFTPIPEAPTDGKQYARKNSGWVEVNSVSKSFSIAMAVALG